MEKVCDKVGFLHDGVITYESDLKDLTKQNAIRVVFAHPYEGQLESEWIACEVKDANTVKFVLLGENKVEAQKELFSYLATLDNPVVSIENDSKSLEEVFQEVCGL